LVGQTVTVKLKNQTIYEGVFHSCSLEGDVAITLKSARQVPTGHGKSGEVKEEMVIAGKDFLQVNAVNVPSEPKHQQHSTFKTDGEIAEGWGEDRSRELVAWKSSGE
ncbi:CID4, partial [Symbiodinium pilosum]